MFDSTAHRRARVIARLIVGLALCLSLCTTALAQRPTGGLVAHYPLDGSLEDVTTNAYDGQASGGPVYAGGIAGQALRFDGVDDALRFARLPNSVFAGDFTIAWYMNAASLDEWSILSKRNTCATGDWFEVGGSRVGSDLLAFNLSRTSGLGSNVFTARQRYFAPGWLHVAVVRRGSEAFVYVDGEASAAASLATLDFSRITALLGFSSSPCIGTSGVRAFQGLLDDVRVYNRALDAREIDTLASIAQITVTPSSIAPGGFLSYTATELDIGTTYSLRLFDGAGNPVLDSFQASAVEQRRRVVMPNAVVGTWPLRLQVPSPRLIVSTHASTTLTVTQGLAVTVRTAAPQAGKSLQVDVARLAPGRLQLRYAGRIVAGPFTIDAPTTTRALKFVAPSDIPASFPANVELRAELIVGRSIARSGTAQVSVAAPFSGPFALPTGVTNSAASGTSSTPLNVRGRLQLADGATPSNVQFSAFWVGDDGSFTPLPTHSLAIAADGTFDLATRPSGIATMTAGVATGRGRIRLGTVREGSNGRLEWLFTDGPAFTNDFDTDAQTDITFTIRRVGGNINEPVANALVVFDSVTPIQEFDLPPAPPSGNNSPYAVSGQSFYRNLRVNDLSAPLDAFSQADAVNQVGGLQPSIEPEPACGPDLFRRYTDANGRASVDLLGSNPARRWASFTAQQFQATDCSGGRCRTAQPAPLRFRARIYTVHRGAGVITNGREDPLVFEFLFNRQTRVFNITNLRTGQTFTQTNSVNLTVQVPVLSDSSNYVYIQAPYVVALEPTLGYVRRKSDDSDYGMREVTFSGWVSFHRAGLEPFSPEYQFVVPPPRFSLGFWHGPDAGGALTGARLYLRSNAGASWTLYGDFVRNTSTPVCNLQDDGTFASSNHYWQLTLDGNDWRDPTRMGAQAFRGDSNPGMEGKIEYRNEAGAAGSYPIRFEWKAPPDQIIALGAIDDAEPVLVNDRKIGHVLLQSSSDLGHDERTLTLPNDPGGYELRGPRDRTNRSAASQLINITDSGDGDTSGASIVSGDVDKTYNEGPRNRQSTASAGGSLANFGARDYTTLLDEEILLLQVTWGIPGLAGVDAYAAMRLLAEYWFGGRAGVDDDGNGYFEALTDARFSIYLLVGIDIDVLFGLLFDAGVTIGGGLGSSMQTSYISNRADPIDAEECFSINMYLVAYFDPCPICPTPAVSETYNLTPAGSGGDCPDPLGMAPGAPMVQSPLLPSQPQRGLGTTEQRALRRHVAMRFDDRGNGGMMSLDDNRNLTYSSLAPDDGRPPVVLSTAAGQRQPTIAFYAPNKAISVWVENALTNTELQALDTSGYASAGFPVAVRNQRLAWSKFNGSTWTPKQFLTLPGSGEAFPVLEACREGTAGCPVGGSVFLAFQRNINGNFVAPRNRIFHAGWTPSGGWSAVTQTPAGADATQDITPSVVFVDGRPLVTWVRISSANQLSLQRRLMWQFPGLGAVNGKDLPNGANSLSLIAQPPENGRNMFGAFLVPETNTGIIGSGQALHLLRGLCTVVSQTCDFSFVKATVDGDPGSAVYGDRPNVQRSNSGRSVYMRVYSFTPKDPVAAKASHKRAEAAFEEWRTAKDPLHKQAALRGFELNLFLGASAELYRMTANFVSGEVVPTAITADGGNYLGATSAYDAFRDRVVVAGAPVFAADTAASLRMQANSGALSRSVASRSVAVVNGLEVRETDDIPDLRVDDVRITRGTFGPSQRLDVTVTVRNAGSTFRALADGPANLQLRLGAPTGAGAPLASVAIPDMADGAERDFVLAVTMPADAWVDEENMLYASLVLDADTPDLIGDNNVNVLPLPGLPVPTTLLASTRMGMPVTQLQWRGSSDPRVVGYRVYRREANGQFVAHGASTVEGFLDLSAQFGVMRTYAVSSYSARGVESPLSEPVNAAPEAAIAGPEGDELFRNGFEALVP